MALAILIQSYGRFGGAERVALSHYVELRRMNVDATLFFGGLLSEGWKKRLSGHNVRRLPVGIARSPKEVTAIIDLIRELSRFDKIVVHHHVDPLLAFQITKILGRKTIWYSGSMFELPWEEYITGVDYRRISSTVKRTSTEFYGRTLSTLLLSNAFYGLTVRLARAIDIQTVRRYSKILANSEFLSKLLMKTYGLKELPNVVYPGTDPILEQISSQEHMMEEDYMLAVGPLIPLKNIEGMIRGAANVLSAKLVVIGDGQERDMLQKLAKDLGVSLEVRGICNDEEEMGRLYSRCKFLVHLSLYEPFGLTPVEAGLFGKPSIVTSQGGPAEVVIDNETGYIVGPRDYETINRKMSALLQNRDLRKTMGERARNRVIENFTLERSTEQFLAEIES